MDSPPKLTGETLVVHHIPLVHCQVPDRQCCSANRRTSPFLQSDLGVRQPNSLPEWNLLPPDSLAYSSFLQAPDKEQEDRESASQNLAAPGVTKRQNPFLLRDSEAWDLCEDDPGQKSFRLHNSRPTLCPRELPLPPFHLHNSNPVVKPWGGSGGMEAHAGPAAEEDAQKRRHLAPECMELDESSGLGGDQSGFNLEPQWASKSDELMNNQESVRSRTCSCSSSDLQRCRCCSLSSQSEPLDQQMGYVSDSSCNSSDGVLVNFSALYHQRNSHPHTRLNSGSLSCDSSSGSQSDIAAFYLDLHSSPQEAKMPGELQDLEGPGKACGCHCPSSPLLDANCNSYPPLCDPCPSDDSDLPACFQSQARLVVATQNYYKLVTCDLSSQSSPSPPGSSITSCSEEQTRSSPGQPTEYYLFQRPEQSDTDGSREESQGETEKNAIEGQVYINISPPSLAGGRQRSRSYDRHLDRSPTSRLGSLERMLSCPVKLSDSTALAAQSSLPKRVTSFAELAKGRKKNGSSPPLRTSRDSSLEFSPIPEGQKDSSVFLEDQARHSQSLSPTPVAHSLGRGSEGELGAARRGPGSREGPSCGQEGAEPLFSSARPEVGPNSTGVLGQKDVRARADGGVADGKVVRYSKDQRPTTLPIQPFVFQHHFPKPPKARALPSHLTSSLSQLYSLSAASRSTSQQLSSTSQSSTSATSADQLVGAEAVGQGPCSSLGGGCAKKQPVPESTRPSPLGSYSPVRNNVPFFQSVDSSSSSSSTPESHPPRSKSCPVSANLLPSNKPSPAAGSCATQAGPRASAVHNGSENPSPVAKKAALPDPLGPSAKDKPPNSIVPPLSSIVRGLATVGSCSEPPWKIGSGEAASIGPLGIVIPRPLNANHLSPQALKWREYRRRNPLGLDRASDLAGLTNSLDWKQPESRPPWRNPILEIARLHGQSVKQPQLGCPDFFPDYFSLAEKPPAEFCLSPDGNTESISIDLLQKKGLVKAVNVAVDLIVAHFGTSRDPGVKAKLGNSSVSPNVGHLVLKYLCPAIQDILSDGLKAYVLDVIVGQRRNIPWSIVEASTQLGPSTKVLHSLYSRISQYPQLSSHHMRFNAFLFGLLNLGSLEFWFNHLYNHEDIIQAHYQPVGFLSLSRGACQGLFEEVLLLLQPLSLLPFRLDLLFESCQLQVGQEQQQQKELLRVQQDLLLSCHSTLQLMRSRGGSSSSSCARDPVEPHPSRGAPIALPLERAVAERAKGVGAPAVGHERRGQEGSLEQKKADRQASWWLQLTQSSQVYIEASAEGARLNRSERKKKAGGAAVTRLAEARRDPPPREGVVEGAEACPLTEAPHIRGKPPAEEAESPWKQGPPAGADVEEKSRPFWMGSPPDAVLTELKRSKEQDQGRAPGKEETAARPPEGGQPKWARLFGLRQAPKDPKQANRLPSGWLSWDRSMLQLMVQTVGASIWREADAEPKQQPATLPPLCPEVQPSDGDLSAGTSWVVKALCHHLATEAGQLSFRKGDILRVLDKVDVDWLRCSRGGAESGLVPVMYVTHMEDVDY